jgi:hypothetical protein
LYVFNDYVVGPAVRQADTVLQILIADAELATGTVVIDDVENLAGAEIAEALPSCNTAVPGDGTRLRFVLDDAERPEAVAPAPPPGECLAATAIHRTGARMIHSNDRDPNWGFSTARVGLPQSKAVEVVADGHVEYLLNGWATASDPMVIAGSPPDDPVAVGDPDILGEPIPVHREIHTDSEAVATGCLCPGLDLAPGAVAEIAVAAEQTGRVKPSGRPKAFHAEASDGETLGVLVDPSPSEFSDSRVAAGCLDRTWKVGAPLARRRALL